jgi:hypothetical protein
MSIVLPALAVAFAAFCVWLTVRIVNRRERWAKWTLTAVLAVAFLGPPVSYPWAKGVLMTSPRAETMTELITLCSLFERGLFSCPDFIGQAYLPYYVWCLETWIGQKGESPESSTAPQPSPSEGSE